LTELQIPDFVVIGHVCQDIQPGGELKLGGSVSYAATTAHRMGYRVGVVTSAGPDLDVAQAFPFAEIVCHPSPATTVFENIYADGTRKQIVHQRADVITCEQIPPDWRKAPLIYLGTIDQEIDADVFHCFPESALLGVMPQGFFRRWDDQGRIYFAPWTPGDEILKRISVLVISELDVPDPLGVAQEWGKLVDFVIVTHAERGASVYQAEEVCHFPARPAQQVDPTGAGDVFSAAFLIRLYETGDTCASAAFANAAGSFSVEKPGLDGIPNRRQVEDFFAREGNWMLSER
jgi:sugar/nucleoside kinase (ribokinase family)